MHFPTTTQKSPHARYFVFEGINGIGKKTQAARLYLALKDLIGDEKLVRTGEPWYAGSQGAYLQHALQHHSASPEEFFTALMENRADHLQRVVLPALEAGKIVLQRRGLYSTVAYQAAQGLSLPELIKAHEGIEVPDAVIVLYADLDVAQERLQKMHIASEHKPDQFETREVQEQVLAHFHEMHNYFPQHPIYRVDATGSPHAIHRILFDQVLKDHLEDLLPPQPTWEERLGI